MKLLDMTLKFICQTAAIVGQVKQQILSMERSSVCGAIVQSVNDAQIYAKPEVLLNQVFAVELSFSLLSGTVN